MTSEKAAAEKEGGLGLKPEDGTQKTNSDPIKSNHRYKIPANHSDSVGPRMQANAGCRAAKILCQVPLENFVEMDRQQEVEVHLHS